MRETIEMGEELFSQGKLEEAQACFQKLISESPDDPRVLNDLGVVKLAQGDLEEAERCFLKALEIQNDYADARANLADLLYNCERWEQTLEHLEELVKVYPDHIHLLRMLARANAELGRPEEGRKLLDSSRTLSLTKDFIDSLWSSLTYWELEKDLTLRERLEGAVAGVLGAIDGKSGPNVHFQLVAQDNDTGEPLILEWLSDSFYYQQNESYRLERLKLDSGDGPREVLTIGDHPDWKFFRFMLSREINEEGGCLGDFTQTKKVLKRETRLKKYDIHKTLDYFHQNVGPCDCHVYRAIMV